MTSSHRSPTWLVLLFVLTTLGAVRSAEYIILSGGPALQQWEQFRAPGFQHDRWWGNFVRSARVRMQEIQKAQPGQPITWLVYRGAYERRAAESGEPLISYVESVRDKYGIKLVYIRSGQEVIDYINSGNGRRSNKISGFEYFGHSNKHCFMFDYSSDVYGASSAYLHERDLRKIRSSAFMPNALCQSWGCHTGESMSASWKQATGIWMIGAYGKTDYSDGHLTGWKVRLSRGAHWRTRG